VDVRRVHSWRAVRPILTAKVRHWEDRLIRRGFLPGHCEYRKFVVVTQSRAGSNLLISLLNSHPHVDARGELFRELGGQSVESRLETIFGSKPRRIQAVGFKIFYYHPVDEPNSQAWACLLGLDDLHIFHLKRRNTLRTLTSRKLAAHTGIWLERRGGPTRDKPMVHFSYKELERAFRQNEAWETSYDERFCNHETMEIYYEDLVHQPALLEHATNFLGVRPRVMSTSLRHQNPEPLAALITNFDELRLHFQGSRWATFFDDR
jgi:LPS sulfotransferase NodH